MTTLSTSLPLATTRRFYVGLGVVAAVIAFVGFWPTYFGPLLAGTVEKRSFIHFHAAVYVGWLIIFITQTVFAARRRIDLHIRLGKISIVYGVIVILVGLLAGFGMFAVRVRAGEVAEAQRRLLAPLVDMLVFAPFFAAAVYHRRRPELHKRLMIVATTTLLIAAVVRLRFRGDPLHPGLVLLIWSSPILLAMGYDFAKRRIVHPVYLLGLAVMTLESPMFRQMARGTEAWQSFSTWMVTLVS
jgi:hypothetical protein